MSMSELNTLLRWIVRELRPRINKEFNVSHDVGNTAIGGSSMGGLEALHAHFRRPDIFGAYRRNHAATHASTRARGRGSRATLPSTTTAGHAIAAAALLRAQRSRSPGD